MSETASLNEFLNRYDKKRQLRSFRSFFPENVLRTFGSSEPNMSYDEAILMYEISREDIFLYGVFSSTDDIFGVAICMIGTNTDKDICTFSGNHI
jgi:hypothetical protein